MSFLGQIWASWGQTRFYWVLPKIMWPSWARLIVAPPASGQLKVTLSVFLNSGGSWWFFEHEIYIKSKGRLSNNTNVLEPAFSDIYFTSWFSFSYIFSVFVGLTGLISGFLHFFNYFIFLFNTSWSHAYDVGWFILMRASYWPWMRIVTGASCWDQ